MRLHQSTHRRFFGPFTALVIGLFATNIIGASQKIPEITESSQKNSEINDDIWYEITTFLKINDIKQVRRVCQSSHSQCEKVLRTQIPGAVVDLIDFNFKNPKQIESLTKILSLGTPHTIKLPKCVSEEGMKKINQLLGTNVSGVKVLEFRDYSLKDLELLDQYKNVKQFKGTMDEKIHAQLHTSGRLNKLLIDDIKSYTKESNCSIM